MPAVGKSWELSEHSPLIGLLLGGLLLRSTIAAFLPPGFDEAYYYLYTRHLDWSYFDHPLLVALSTGLGPWLTGNVSQFTIRCGALLLQTGSLLLLYLTSLRLFSKSAAVLTLTIASLIPIFQIGFGVLTLPDSPLIFFWTAALYASACEFFRQPGHYRPSYRLAIVGLLVGIACLGKYHGLALGFGLVGFCLTQATYRGALVSKWTLLSLGLFTLAIVPIVLWNAQHDWISLRFQSGRAIPDRGYSLVDLAVTFLAGIAYLFPSFGLPLWWVSGRSWVTPSTIQPDLAQTRLVLWTALPLMLSFTLMGGYRPILPTWAMPGFWSATLLLGYWAVAWQARSPRGVRRWLWGSGLAIVSLLLVVLLHVTTGIFQQSSRYALFGGFLPASRDASVQLIDIHQLRQAMATSPAVSTALQQSDFLFTQDLYLAGQVGMAIAPLTSKPITCFDADLRGFAFWSTREQWVEQNGLLVVVDRQSQAATAQFGAYFQQIREIAAIPIRRGGAIVQTLHIYQCQRLLKPYPRPYG